MRSLFAAILILAVSPAAAFSPCPTMTAGWAQSYPGPITAVLYDESSLLLSVIWHNTIATTYSNVPFSVISVFSRSTNPVAVYDSYVVPSYHAILLSEKNNCPIIQENPFLPNGGGYIWTD
jgi:hypothetical protein